jgi:hypothetical protein
VVSNWSLTGLLLHFGAVGDGVADDTQAFLDAIAAAERGAVFVPSGRYKITQVLFIEKSNIVLRGESRDSTVLFFPETLYDVVGPGKDGGPTGWSWGGGWIWSNPELERGDSDPPVWDEGVRLARVTTAARKGETRPGRAKPRSPSRRPPGSKSASTCGWCSTKATALFP